MILKILVGYIKFLEPKPPHLSHMKKAHLLIIQPLVQNWNTAVWRNRPGNISACNIRLLQLKQPFLFHISSYFMDLGLDSLATKGTGYWIIHVICISWLLWIIDRCHVTFYKRPAIMDYISVFDFTVMPPFWASFIFYLQLGGIFYLAACFSHFWFQAFCST